MESIRLRCYVNALAQTLLKLTAPGVPDVYQGTELWTFHFVDPDNRRPVDYEARGRLLAEIKELDASAIWASAEEGVPKLWVVSQALALRRRQPETFSAGAYVPLSAAGSDASHVVAFARGETALTIVPRLLSDTLRLAEATMIDLPPGEWRNVLTSATGLSGRVSLSNLWREFPVTLLERMTA